MKTIIIKLEGKKKLKSKETSNHIEFKVQRRKESKNLNRFYTTLDMAIIKKDAANRNGQIKRGEIQRKGNEGISVCGCGVEGCFIHFTYDNVKK